MILSLYFIGCTKSPLKMNGIHKVYAMDINAPTYIKIIDDKNLKLIMNPNLHDDQKAIKLLNQRPLRPYIRGKRGITIWNNRGRMNSHMRFNQNKDGSFQDSKFLEIKDDKIVNETIYASNAIVDIFKEDGTQLTDFIFKEIEKISLSQDCRTITIQNNFIEKSYPNIYTDNKGKIDRRVIKNVHPVSKYSQLYNSPIYKKLKEKYLGVRVYGSYGYIVYNFKYPNLKKGNKEFIAGFVNEEGELLLPLQYDRATFSLSNSIDENCFIAGKKNEMIYNQNSRRYNYKREGYILFDVKQKKILFKADYLNVDDKYKQYISFNKNSKTGLLNTKGEIVFPLQDKYHIESANNGIIAYSDGYRKIGLMDFKFNKIVDDISRVEYKKDYFIAINSSGGRFYNYKGEEILKHTYYSPSVLTENLIQVGHKHHVGVIDLNEKKITPFKYDTFHSSCGLLIGALYDE